MNRNKGFTIFELIITITILAILATVIGGNFVAKKRTTDVKSTALEILNIILLAKNKTLTGVALSQYGVYFDDAANPMKYVLFKGVSYATRDTSADVSYSIPTTQEIYSISLGGGKEVVWSRLTGLPSASGNISLRLKADTAQNRTIYISSGGTVDFASGAAPSDSNRIKDSRHVHFDYSRQNFVSCSNTDATLSLYFDGAQNPQKTVSICGNLSSSNLEWEEKISIGESEQTVKISTHHLLDPNYGNGTQFSIHRDRSLNNKSLKIMISGDSGYLIEYSADGSTVTHSSSYVSNSSWQ